MSIKNHRTCNFKLHQTVSIAGNGWINCQSSATSALHFPNAALRKTRIGDNHPVASLAFGVIEGGIGARDQRNYIVILMHMGQA